MASSREELDDLRRLDELESKASARPEPSMGEVALNAIPKGIANIINTPVTVKNLIMSGVAALPGAGHFESLQSAAEPTPNYPMAAARKMGLVDPAKEPQTGGQRIVDTAVQSAIGGLVGPGGVAKNLAIGALSGAVAQTTKEATGSDLLAVAAGVATPFAVSGVARAIPTTAGTEVRRQTLKEAQDVGYVVQPSTVKPTAITNKLESIAGKAAVAQDAALRNQEITNRLAARAIGVADDAPLTMQTIEEVRKQAAKPYQEVEALRPTLQMAWFPRYHSKNLLDELKQARADKTALYRAYDRSADPSMLKEAKKAGQLAESIERDIEAVASAAGKPELVGQLKNARELYARTFDVERALNLADGNVSAPIIGRMLDHGVPLSGDLKVIGKFAQAFPRVAREAASIPPPSVSGTDAAASALLATAGYGAAGGPAGLLAAGLPLLRSPARNLVLSKGFQSRLLKSPPPLSTTAARSGLAARSLLDIQQGQD